jgi:tetratricopeptide (TPR) repeat protein
MNTKSVLHLIPRAVLRLVVSVAFLRSCSPALAVSDPVLQLKQAQELSDRGNEAEAIEILGPIVHSRPPGLGERQMAIAWNILGSSYQGLGKYQVARQSYESAIRLVQGLPTAEDVFVSSLNDLASLSSLEGQLDAASNLRLKARKIYRNHGDWAGLVRTDDGLATIALSKNNLRAADKFLRDAGNDAEHSASLDDSDRAEMYALRASLAVHHHDFAGAVGAYERSLKLWSSAQRRPFDVIAWEHALLGDAYRELGNLTAAEKELMDALELLKGHELGGSPVYFRSEILYARVVRATGDKDRATHLTEEADTALKNLARRQCNGCIIGADALH